MRKGKINKITELYRLLLFDIVHISHRESIHFHPTRLDVHNPILGSNVYLLLHHNKDHSARILFKIPPRSLALLLRYNPFRLGEIPPLGKESEKYSVFFC